jgi:hypothetical protein
MSVRTGQVNETRGVGSSTGKLLTHSAHWLWTRVACFAGVLIPPYRSTEPLVVESLMGRAAEAHDSLRASCPARRGVNLRKSQNQGATL